MLSKRWLSLSGANYVSWVGRPEKRQATEVQGSQETLLGGGGPGAQPDQVGIIWVSRRELSPRGRGHVKRLEDEGVILGEKQEQKSF